MVRTMLTSLGLLLGACSVGQVDGLATDANGSGDNGAATFSTMVAPLVTLCTGCHGGTQDPNLSSYALLKAKYKVKPGASNILVTEDVVTGTPGTHHGISFFTAAQKTTVAAWIDGIK